MSAVSISYVTGTHGTELTMQRTHRSRCYCARPDPSGRFRRKYYVLDGRQRTGPLQRVLQRHVQRCRSELRAVKSRSGQADADGRSPCLRGPTWSTVIGQTSPMVRSRSARPGGYSRSHRVIKARRPIMVSHSGSPTSCHPRQGVRVSDPASR